MDVELLGGEQVNIRVAKLFLCSASVNMAFYVDFYSKWHPEVKWYFILC